MDSPQQCVPIHRFLLLEPSIVQATSFHQQLPLWMCLPLIHPSALFSLRRDFSPVYDETLAPLRTSEQSEIAQNLYQCGGERHSSAKVAAYYRASCKIIWNASHNPFQIEAMYLESIRRFSRQYSKIFRFTVRNYFSIVTILSTL